MHCKICAADSTPFGKGKTLILDKYDVQYYRCGSCGFIQTEEPYWLDEAYARPIAATDVGYVYRNKWLSWCARVIIGLFYNGAGRFLDYGGGYGLFVREMRDCGYDFYLLDKYTPNLFAWDFQWQKKQAAQPVELTTAFEVFEHLPDPHAGLQEIMQNGSDILLSTFIVPTDLADTDPDSWFYFASSEGQHISLFTVKSLQILAERNGLHCYSNGRNLHLLTKRPSMAKAMLFPLVSRIKAARVLQTLFHRRSLLTQDGQLAGIRGLPGVVEK